MTPTRIRWEDGIYGTNHLGYVGALDDWTFQIFKPSDDADDNERTLMASLPGFLGRRCPGDDVEYLKALAEKWLGEFVASLGAIFPADATDDGVDELPYADRHIDLDAGEFGGAMTDADYYDRIKGDGNEAGQ